MKDIVLSSLANPHPISTQMALRCPSCSNETCKNLRDHFGSQPKMSFQ